MKLKKTFLTWLPISIFFLTPLKGSFKDFGNAAALAREWGEKIFHQWHWNAKTETAWSSIYNYTNKDSKVINKYLRENKGKLIEEQGVLSKNIFNNYQRMNEDIKAIDNLLNEVTLPTSIYLYRRLQEQFLASEKYKFNGSGSLINPMTIKYFNENLINKNIIQHSFLSTSLINNPNHVSFNHIEYPILMQIKAPQGTHAGYLGFRSYRYYDNELEVLIARNYGLKYESISFINEGIKKTIKITALLTNNNAEVD